MRSTLPIDPAFRQILDGAWQFRLFEHPDAVPADAVTSGIPDGGGGWHSVQVPGNWTMQVDGDHPHYTNIQMPFPGPPPATPARNPTGVYRRTFALDSSWTGRRLVLHVGGAESVHAVFLNGAFVGYGTDSRLPSEYDVTDVVRSGENDLAVVVIRYSAHSYVEDQDQWWMAGLHRTVYVEARASVHIGDVEVDADWDPVAMTGSLSMRSTVRFEPNTEPMRGYQVRARLEDAEGGRIGSETELPVPHRHFAPYVFKGHVVTATWPDLAVRPWSAESPTRYTVRVELVDPEGAVVDSTTQQVGFRRIEVRDRQLLVNDVAVWIFGVNRHDHHPDRGKAVTVDDMRADLSAMRALNITAIRTSHYPNDSTFLDLCDELGFYVIDEANIESHGYNHVLCDDPTYRGTWLERGARMVTRDRNHPCVIAWSLGNESGYGDNHDALAGWIRSADPSRPLHYEDAIRLEGWNDGGRAATDIVCPMYPTIDSIAEYGESGLGDRPLIMCEYSHAMGNSNGSLADYWDVITSTPGLQGGFMWEWKDHGLRQVLADGTRRLAYGGQFGDIPNDCNFVADGVMSADLEPHPAAAEMAWVYRPVTVRLTPDGMEIENRQSFIGLDWMRAEWELSSDGVVTASGNLEVGDVGPRTAVAVPLPVAIVDAPCGVDVCLTVRWTSRDTTWWAPAGHLVSWDQMTLAERVASPNGSAPESEATGSTLPADSVSLPQPRLNLFRAATDNDGFKLMPDLAVRLRVGGQALREWQVVGLDRLDPEDLVRHVTKRTVDPAGTVGYHHIVEVPDELADAPRVGVVLQVAGRFERVRWFGHGPHENYPDRRASAMLAIWDQPIDRLPYLVPQEFGLRTDCRWLELVDRDTGRTLRIDIDGPPLHMSVIRHTSSELFAAASTTDLHVRDDVIVCLDVAHRGLGTASCGPDVLPEYRIEPGRYEFGYRLSSIPA